MATFQSKRFRGSADASRLGARYRVLMSKHPFLTFGLPFVAVVVAGSFVLTPATAIRYERHDRKVRQMTREEELGIRRGARRVDMKDEYYVSGPVGGAAWRGRARQGLTARRSGWQGETWTTGSRSGWSGCRARATASCDERAAEPGLLRASSAGLVKRPGEGVAASCDGVPAARQVLQATMPLCRPPHGRREGRDGGLPAKEAAKEGEEGGNKI